MKVYQITLKISTEGAKPSLRTGCVAAINKTKAEQIALEKAKEYITSKECELSFSIHKVKSIPSVFIWGE